MWIEKLGRETEGLPPVFFFNPSWNTIATLSFGAM